MPDSQNKQGEKSDTPRSDAASWFHDASTHPERAKREMTGRHVRLEFAQQLERELSLLSQQHAPPKEVEERIDDFTGWLYQGGYWSDRSSLRKKLTELTTELTKGMEEEVRKAKEMTDAWHSRSQAHQQSAEYASTEIEKLRQQLAEATKMLTGQIESANKWESACEQAWAERDQLSAQNIALSAVVDASKALIERLTLIHGNSKYQAVWAHWWNHYGQYDGPKYTAEFEELTQLLADLGQIKP